jgi:hypothetical protein
MQRHEAMNFISRLGLALIFLCTSALSVYAMELTQRDWMISLVDATGWSYGLPDEPQDPDYINILTGNREFRFEAEDIYAAREDNVSLMSFRNFGTFSGSGWLHGSRVATDVHLRFTLPADGTYQLQAHLRKKGHRFNVGETTTTVDAEATFTKVDVGQFQMQAGLQEIVLTLPPGGSVDYINLKADNHVAITPDGGWQPDEALTWETVQTTMLQLLQLAEVFPASQESLFFEAEELTENNLKIVTIPHLGRPSGGKWLRAGPLPATISFPINLKESGFYDISLRAMGKPVTITVGGHQTIHLDAKAYLDDYSLPPYFFFAGKSTITLTLPPGGGVDWLSLTGRQIEPDSASTLLGINSQGPPSSRDIDSLTALLATFGVER